ncbi:MAG: hypothetical protein NUV80_00065 [Candidatus Berkelbacteria bacterium]|nr:hypothetical protein [Candidatus Berkelbacteria bacterium]MCR4306946.1 hypothetical protein [Candidatus Berkelbacteria bacterium]
MPKQISKRRVTPKRAEAFLLEEQTTAEASKAIATGWFDNHVHLDRALTYADDFFQHEGGLTAFSDAPLPRKQTATGVLHRGTAYTKESLEQRMRTVIEAKIKAGEIGMNAITDCSVDIGSRAFDVALKLRAEYVKKGYELKVGAYPIFGFKDWGSDRYELLEELASRAQFLVGLPERDDRPGHPVGFNGHLRLLIDLALRNNIPLQVHVDQTNTPNEGGTERLVEAVRWNITAAGIKNPPPIWAVHMISPSCDSEDRFKRLVDGLIENNIGVIVCPHAALSNRQMRNHVGPIHNSLARVRELLVAGVPVRIGTDNLSDLFMPGPESVLLQREYDVLPSILRFYNKSVLDKIFTAERLNETDKDALKRSLDGDREAFELTE